MSAESLSAPLPSSTAAGVGLGYGIAIAVGLLVLVSTIMLASYVCIRVNGGRSSGSSRPRSSAAAPSSATVGSAPVAGGTPSDASVFVVVGLDSATIEAYYPKFVYNASSAAPPGPCPICLAEYEGGEALRRVPECGHCFHAGCVDEWLRVSATCPLCRSSPVPSPAATPVATPLSELIPLAVHAR